MNISFQHVSCSSFLPIILVLKLFQTNCKKFGCFTIYTKFLQIVFENGANPPANCFYALHLNVKKKIKLFQQNPQY